MRNILALLLLFAYGAVNAQSAFVSGHVTNDGEPLSFVDIVIVETGQSTLSGEDGKFSFEVKPGQYTMKATILGFKQSLKDFEIKVGQRKHIDIVMIQDVFGLDQVVVSSSRNEVNRKESTVSVNVLNEHLFDMIESSTMSQGLSYTSGLRMEYKCQNCGQPEVKMNGLGGSYSQILIDGRPVYGSLSAVYGLEQIPSNMIERIEVVKGGGSALYGANAIAGTINVITKDPLENSYQISNNYSLINGQSGEYNLNFNSTTISDAGNMGVSFFASYRNKEHYDHNGDGFSEIGELESQSFGTKAFYKPNTQSRIGLEAHFIKDYRRGGNLFERAPHQSDITEMTDHSISNVNINYELYSDDYKNKFSSYLAVQNVDRYSYFGGGGNSSDPQDIIDASNYYGDSKSLTAVLGFQYSRNWSDSELLVGSELKYDKVQDNMVGYQRSIDQTVNNVALFAQLEHRFSDKFKVMLGGRFDYLPILGEYNLETYYEKMNNTMKVFTPRVSLMYNFNHDNLFRFTYSTGFRPPQTFDEDLHVETIGGQAKIVRLASDLETETSNSLTFGYEMTKTHGNNSFDFIFDGFYTKLNNSFVNVPLFEDPNSNVVVVEKRNSSGVKVYGGNFEFKSALGSSFNFQLGYTAQLAKYNEEEVVLEGEDNNGNTIEVTSRDLLKSPNHYGYATIQYNVTSKFKINSTTTYTGKMLVANQNALEIRETKQFLDTSIKLSYQFEVSKDLQFEISGGMKNILNSYQDDFEFGVDRDAGYIYGPTLPRTVYAGVKLGIL
jgi:outer membrane receptor for ferrienterochelin and colicins